MSFGDSESQVGIVGYGAYVPLYRLPGSEIVRIWTGGRGGSPVREKAVAGLDEDVITMSIEASRNAIARARINRPKLILADEPTGNLDTRTSDEIMDLLQRLNREQGITILFVTHDPEIAEYCNRVIHFRDGRIESDQNNHTQPAADQTQQPLPTGPAVTDH